MTVWMMVLYACPIAYFRFTRFFWPESFLKPNLVRKNSEIELHHGHLGFFGLLILAWCFIFFPEARNIYVAWVGAVCFGFLSDEIIPYFASAKGAGREAELHVYDKSFGPTIHLAICVEILLAISCKNTSL
jgi:hypothetical protein